MSTTDKQLCWEWIKHHDLSPLCWITVTQRGSVQEEPWMARVHRFLLKLSKYSGQHLGGIVSYETGNSTHSHILLLGERPIDHQFIEKRWKVGIVDCRSIGSQEEDVRRLVFYALKHPRLSLLRNFCPNPRKCTSPACRLTGSARK